MRYVGGCGCGAVRYTAEAEPLNQRVCHCRLCQKVVGAAFFGRLLFRLADVTITGPVTEYATSPELTRGFCPACGTSLYARRDRMGVIGISCGSLDDPSQFRPTEHIFTSSRQPWLADDGLPAHPGRPPPG